MALAVDSMMDDTESLIASKIVEKFNNLTSSCHQTTKYRIVDGAEGVDDDNYTRRRAKSATTVIICLGSVLLGQFRRRLLDRCESNLESRTVLE